MGDRGHSAAPSTFSFPTRKGAALKYNSKLHLFHFDNRTYPNKQRTVLPKVPLWGTGGRSSPHPPSPSPKGKERRLNTTPNFISSTSTIEHIQTNKELFYLSSPLGDRGHSAAPSTFSFPKGKGAALKSTPNFISSTSTIEHIQTNKELFYLSSPLGDRGLKFPTSRDNEHFFFLLI